jgi:hypothetical protein
VYLSREFAKLSTSKLRKVKGGCLRRHSVLKQRVSRSIVKTKEADFNRKKR